MALVRQYNASSSKFGQLTGAKAASVKNLLESLPREALELVNISVREFGWKSSPFTDDSFSGRKFLPGSQFRSSHKVWQQRGKVTRDSCILQFRQIYTQHCRTAP